MFDEFIGCFILSEIAFALHKQGTNKPYLQTIAIRRTHVIDNN